MSDRKWSAAKQAADAARWKPWDDKDCDAQEWVRRLNGGSEAAVPASPFDTVPLSIDEWMSRDLPEPDRLLGSWLTTTSRALLNAATGVGKTNFAMQIGLSIAAGKGFLHWCGYSPRRVLYVDGEMSRRLLKERIKQATERLGTRPEGFFAFSHEDVESFAPLNTPEGQRCIEQIIAKIGCVDLGIFDSVMCLTDGDMKDEESWAQTMPWVRKLTRRNIGQLWVHHTGHNQTRGYGTSTREWQLDTVAIMETVQRDDTDVSFRLEFNKARERTPATRADFQPVKIALVNDQWESKAVRGQRTGQVSPLGLKFLNALHNATVGNEANRMFGHPAASFDLWKAECTKIGLLDLEDKPDSARSLFSKHRRELIAANSIACNDTMAWVL